eukprot:5597832-Amphidinium_carterae.1
MARAYRQRYQRHCQVRVVVRDILVEQARFCKYLRVTACLRSVQQTLDARCSRNRLTPRLGVTKGFGFGFMVASVQIWFCFGAVAVHPTSQRHQLRLEAISGHYNSQVRFNGDHL